MTTGDGKTAKRKVLSQQNPATPVVGKRAHRHGKEGGEERKGRKLTSDVGEAFPARNWMAQGWDSVKKFSAIAVVLPRDSLVGRREKGLPFK